MSDFFRKQRLILSEVFWYMEKDKNLEKNIYDREKYHFSERVWT